MADTKTISSNPPEHTGMNYSLLRKEGMELIEKLAGHTWTDHNTHDPGITILEHLCYAITDLSFRLSFPMEDLLALPMADSQRPDKQYFEAHEVLTVNPVTINDYRKLLIDIPGVKNAWLTTEFEKKPEIVFDSNDNSLSFQRTESGTKHPLKGYYKVQVEKDETIKISETDLLGQVKKTLQQHRNLCEDFREIEMVQVETVTLNLDIELEDDSDASLVLVGLYPKLAELVSPSIRFYSLAEMINRGKPVEEIYNGPPLKHGFIDDDELKTIHRKKELYVSDFINIILDQPGIKAVESISLSSELSSGEEDWALNLNPALTPKLKDIASLINSGDIRFNKGKIECSMKSKDIRNLESSGTKLKTEKSREIDRGLEIPQGTYRELHDYTLIENDLPGNYGIGEWGLPESASDLRKAQARQLQGYLLLFDQVLANYFSQLDHAKELLSINNRSFDTLFCQIPRGSEHLLDLEALFSERKESERDDRRFNHEKQLLDHLLARFGTRFPDYSLNSPEVHVTYQKNLLKNLASLNANRNKARNVHKIGDTSGLKSLIQAKLGLSDEESDFVIIEHILLYPQEKPEDKVERVLKSGKIKDEFFPDPFSFRLTIVFPQNQGRFADKNFTGLLTEILRSEVPAHILYEVLWVDNTSLSEIKRIYAELLRSKVTVKSIKHEQSLQMLRLLQIEENQPEAAPPS